MSLPNQPCECGSGRKQKKCHPLGAPTYGPERGPRKPQEVRDARKAARTALAVAMMFG